MARRRPDDDGYDDYDDRYEDDDGYDDRPRRGPPPQNYLVFAILTTLLCCWPFGVVAIVYAAQVNSKWEAGDSRGSYASAASAKMWCWLSFGSALVIFAAYIVIIALVAAAGN